MNKEHEKSEKSKIYITITGTNYRLGTEWAEKGMKLELKKEPDNEYDKEAIAAHMPGLGQVGYVANSTRTVIGDSYSAGRLYDKIGDAVRCKVKIVLPNALICTVKVD